jgi:hypothetical protein
MAETTETDRCCRFELDFLELLMPLKISPLLPAISYRVSAVSRPCQCDGGSCRRQPRQGRASQCFVTLRMITLQNASSWPQLAQLTCNNEKAPVGTVCQQQACWPALNALDRLCGFESFILSLRYYEYLWKQLHSGSNPRLQRVERTSYC